MSKDTTKKEKSDCGKENNPISGIMSRLNNPKRTIPEEEFEDLRKKIRESMSYDRQSIILTRPFIGGILMRMELEPVYDYRCGTAMTDGDKIFFDMDFYKSLRQNERIFVLAHEVWHVIYMHFLRRKGREPSLWNIATDCEINYMLKKDGFTPPPDLCFPDSEVAGKNAEEIYEYLLKKAKNKKSGKNGNEQMSQGGSSSSGGGQYGEKGKLSGQFDEHMDKDNDDNMYETVDSLPTGQWGEKGIDPNFTPRISHDAAEKIREMIISEAQRCERSCGKLPGGLENIIERLKTPKIPWRERVAQFMSKTFGGRRAWLPPNRHHVWHDAYFQSRRGEKIEVVVAVDTSGSTLTDLPDFLTEIVSLLNTFGNYEMRLIQADAVIQSDELYDDANPFPMESISNIKFKGFGGTSFCPVFEHIKKKGYECKCLIYFTDSYGDAPAKKPSYPVLWALTRDFDKQFCEWGERVVIE